MCSVTKKVLFRALPFLLTFYIGAGIAMFLRPQTEHFVTLLVRQPAVLVGPEVISVPDADLPDSLRRLDIDSASIKLHGVVGADGRVKDISQAHTLYLSPSVDLSPATSLMLQEELGSIVSQQIKGTSFAPLADNQDSIDVLVSATFVTNEAGCGRILLTIKTDDGRVLWQGNTERSRFERCHF